MNQLIFVNFLLKIDLLKTIYDFGLFTYDIKQFSAVMAFDYITTKAKDKDMLKYLCSSPYFLIKNNLKIELIAELFYESKDLEIIDILVLPHSLEYYLEELDKPLLQDILNYKKIIKSSENF